MTITPKPMTLDRASADIEGCVANNGLAGPARMRRWKAAIDAELAKQREIHQAVFIGTLGGKHVGLHGTKESVEALEAFIDAKQRNAVSADRDAYEGAREDLLDWKGRAQRSEAKLRLLGYTGVDASEPPAGASRDRDDAERYRWLREYGTEYHTWQQLKRLESDEEFDAFIDAARREYKS